MESQINVPVTYGYKGANCDNFIIKQTDSCGDEHSENTFSILNDFGEVMLKDANFKQVMCLYYDLLNGRFVWDTYENPGLCPAILDRTLRKCNGWMWWK